MAARELSPDQLAALEDQKTHLLASLEDLDAERAAGDIDRADYETLRDDYTARTAAVLRAIDSHRAQVASRRETAGRGRKAGWVAAVLLFGVLAGFGVKQASGTRGVNDAGSGDIRQNVRQLLFEAGAAGGQGDYDRSIELYTEVIAEQPSNVEAYTYRGWTVYQQQDEGSVDLALADLDTAVELDETASAPRVFRAVIALNDGRPADAAADLVAFANNDPTTDEQTLLQQFRLRERTADALAADGDVTAPFAFLDTLWNVGQDDPDIAAHLGWMLAAVPDDSIRASAEEWQDKALALDPSHPPALVYRALIRLQDDRIDEAEADLTAYNEGGVYPAFLQAVLADFGLAAEGETDSVEN